MTHAPRSFVVVALLLTASTASAEPRRDGLVLGAAFGTSALRVGPDAMAGDGAAFVASFPNLKIGVAANDRTVLALLLPGSLYTYVGDGRMRHRGFEAVLPSVQYWVRERWWLLGGVGLGLDAPAFYDIEDASERAFHLGVAAAVGTGFDVVTRGSFVLDIQGRLHAGAARVPVGWRSGLAASLLVGVNWY